MTVPETRYAKTEDGIHIAYQVIGDGPIDLVYVHGVNHVEMVWEEPRFAHFLNRLGRFSRLINFDMRGVGLSDPVPLNALPSLDEWMSDIDAVLDGVGVERAAVLAANDGGPMGIMFAAARPERVSALVLANTSPRVRWADDWPDGAVDALYERTLSLVEETWGRPSSRLGVELHSPSDHEDPAFNEWWVRTQRQAASPATATAIFRWYMDLDVRAVLGAIQAPTLVIRGALNRIVPLSQARYLADHIAGARFVEVAGVGHFYFAGDADAFIDEIEEFLTGARSALRSDRVLGTVLFTDIVSSTETAVTRGDHDWRHLLERHDAFVARQVERHRGRVVNTTGDGVIAMFDGPARAVHCALALRDGLRALGIEIRAGLHAGEVEVRREDISGIAVHIGQRVSALAAPGEVLVSRTVTDLVAGSGLEFEERGEHELKGVPGKWAIYAVTS